MARFQLSCVRKNCVRFLSCRALLGRCQLPRSGPGYARYGQTDAPPNIQEYTQFQFVGDVVGLVQILGYEQAVIAGHDLAAMVAHNAAILRPDIFRAIILLSVPYGARTEGAVKPQKQMRKRAPEGQQFYETYFQMPGVAEKEFDADPKRTLRMFLYSVRTRCGSPLLGARLCANLSRLIGSCPLDFKYARRKATWLTSSSVLSEMYCGMSPSSWNSPFT